MKAMNIKTGKIEQIRLPMQKKQAGKREKLISYKKYVTDYLPVDPSGHYIKINGTWISIKNKH